MKWMRFRIRTNEEAEDVIISEMVDIGLTGAQIEDKVPLTAAEKEQMFVDVVPEQEDDGIAYLNFFAELADDNTLTVTIPDEDAEDTSASDGTGDVSYTLNKNVFADEQCSQDPHGDGDVLELAGNSVAENIGDDTEEDTVRDAVCKRHHDEGDESGDCLAVVVPVDCLHGRHHHHTNDDEGGSGCCAGDCQEDRAQEQGQCKEDGD